VGAILVGLLLIIAIAQPAGDPLALDIDDGLSELGAPLPPSGDALLGTDQLGRDVWARLVAGAATSLGVAALATLFGVILGVTVGLTAGYAGGLVDTLLMRLVDLVLAFPALLLAILLATSLRASDLAGANAPVVLTLALVGWTATARLVRARTRVLMRSDMIAAARSLGAPPIRIAIRHLLPNLAGTVLVLAVLGFAQNLLAESTLSYVGLGPPPPAPTWGRMLYEGRTYYRSAPHLVIAPGAAILVAVVGVHLLGAALRERFEGDR
jgi:peptide/nickel transport system permease protein